MALNVSAPPCRFRQIIYRDIEAMRQAQVAGTDKPPTEQLCIRDGLLRAAADAVAALELFNRGHK